MMNTHTILSFAASSLLLAVIPGPDNLFVLAQSATQGWHAGAWVSLGLCTGLVFHTALVALGVATLVQASPLAFTALKCAGAGYLLYLAWQSFRAHADPDAAIDKNPEHEKTPSKKLYVRGILMNITNPKVSIFFLAFLPQFIDPTRGSITLQLTTLGLVFMLTTAVVFTSIARAASALGTVLARSPGATRGMNRVAGTVFAALASRLLLG